MEHRSPALCIFDRPGSQTDILKSSTVDYYPLSSIAGGGPIEFHIPGNADDYIDVNDITLYVKFKVLKADGTAIVDADKVGLNNLPIATLFQDVSLTLGETQIEGGQMCYPYRAYFNTVMQFQPTAQFSHMQAFGWYKDEAGKFNNETNTGFKARKELIDDSRQCELMGPLYLDFTNQERYLISQTDMRIKFTPSKPEFALNAYGATTDFKIKFTDVILYVARSEVNPSVINGHATGLKRQNAFYPLIHNELITFTIPKGQQSYTKDRLFPDQAPKSLMIAMVENDAFNGNIKKNPFHFEHFGLNKIALYRDGVCIPGRPFTPDFDDGKYLRSYLNTIRTMNYYNTDDTNGLTPNMFANGYTIYAYDLTPEKDITAAYNQGITSKNLRLELFFKKTLSTTINVLLFASYNSAVEITQLRDVIPHYTR